MVALSVSTSAIKSPELTLSPTFLCHFAITPSVMVSLIFGIFTTSAMCYCGYSVINVNRSIGYKWVIGLYVYILVQFFRFRIRRIFRKLHTVIDHFFYVGLHLIKP